MEKWVYVDAAKKKLGKLREKLTDKQLAGCVSRAINKSLKDGVKEARSAVKNTYNIPSSYVNEQIKVIPATKTGFVGGIFAEKKPLPLEWFSPKFQKLTSSKKARSNKQTIKKRGRKKSVYYTATQIQYGTSIEVHKGKPQTVPYAFMLPGFTKVFAHGRYRSGGYGFQSQYKRKGKGRGGKNDYKIITPLITMTVNAAMHYKPNLASIKRVTRGGFQQYLLKEVKTQIKNIK